MIDGQMVEIKRESIQSLLLQPRVGTTILGSATGFVVSRSDRHYLITNRHVVRGRHNDTDEFLHPSGAVPDNVIIWHNSRGKLGTWLPKEERLLDVTGRSLWLEHAVYGGRVDVVALPLTDIDDASLYAYDPWNPGPAIVVSPSDLVSIIGFPFGLLAGGAFGIWISGFVASEPQIQLNDLPCFLVDSRTRPGSSGSPVIAHRTGGAVSLEGGNTTLGGGPVTRFLGVYSGRLNEASELGFIWKVTLVAEIIENGRP
jgi:S1-C subfamily serine protease